LSIVFSPTMKITHGVLNIFFEHSQVFFPGVELVKFVPIPETKDEDENGFPTTIEGLQERLKENETVLAELHERVNQGDNSQDEELWERQRQATQIKRKIKLLKKAEKEKEKQAEAARQAQAAAEEKDTQQQQQQQQQQTTTVEVQQSLEVEKPTKQVSDSPKTRPKVLTLAEQAKQQNNAGSQQDIPQKLDPQAQAPTSTAKQQQKIETQQPVAAPIQTLIAAPPPIQRRKNIPPKVSAAPAAQIPPPTTQLPRQNQQQYSTNSLPRRNRSSQSSNENLTEPKQQQAQQTQQKAEDVVLMDDELRVMLLEEQKLLIENEEMFNVSELLRKKIQVERREIESLKDKLQECIEHKEKDADSDSNSSFSSSSSDSSASDQEEDNAHDQESDEEDILQLEMILNDLEKENQKLEIEGNELIQKIITERTLCSQIRTDVRLQEMKLSVR